MKKLTIEIDENGTVDVFVGGNKIGVTTGGMNLIDHLSLSYGDESKKLEVVFRNMLGGLFEASHGEIIPCLKSSIKILKELPYAETSMRFQLKADSPEYPIDRAAQRNASLANNK